MNIDEFLVHNRQILDAPMEIINMFHNNNITYNEAKIILEVVYGMIKCEQNNNGESVILRVEKIDWDNI